MAYSKLVSTLTAAATAGASIPDEQALTLIDWAERHQAWAFIKTLTSQPRGAAVEARLAAIGNAMVRTAWASASHRTDAELVVLVNGESRMRVLSAMIATGRLEGVTLETAVGKAGKLGIKALLEMAQRYVGDDFVLKNLNADLARGVLELASQNMTGNIHMSTPSLGYNAQSLLSDLAAAHPEVAASIEDVTWNSWLAGRPRVPLESANALNLFRVLADLFNNNQVSLRSTESMSAASRLRHALRYMPTKLNQQDTTRVSIVAKMLAAHMDAATGYFAEIARCWSVAHIRSGGLLPVVTPADLRQVLDGRSARGGYAMSPHPRAAYVRCLSISSEALVEVAKETFADSAWLVMFLQHGDGHFSVEFPEVVAVMADHIVEAYLSADIAVVSSWLSPNGTGNYLMAAVQAACERHPTVTWEDLVSVSLHSKPGTSQPQKFGVWNLLALLDSGAPVSAVVQLCDEFPHPPAFTSNSSEQMAGIGSAIFELLDSVVTDSGDLSAIEALAESGLGFPAAIRAYRKLYDVDIDAPKVTPEAPAADIWPDDMLAASVAAAL